MEDQTSLVQVAKGKKTSPLVDLMVNEKFEEERLCQLKALNLRVRVLPKSQDPQKANIDFLHDTLKVQHIIVHKAWFSQDELLIIRFHSAANHFQVLRAKKKLLSLYQDILGCRSHSYPS